MAKFQVYKCTPKKKCYSGVALIAAESAREVNAFIDNFIANDSKNLGDSWGYSYVNEDDRIDCVFANRKGILDYGIYYSG